MNFTIFILYLKFSETTNPISIWTPLFDISAPITINLTFIRVKNKKNYTPSPQHYKTFPHPVLYFHEGGEFPRSRGVGIKRRRGVQYIYRTFLKLLSFLSLSHGRCCTRRRWRAFPCRGSSACAASSSGWPATTPSGWSPPTLIQVPLPPAPTSRWVSETCAAAAMTYNRSSALSTSCALTCSSNAQ